MRDAADLRGVHPEHDAVAAEVAGWFTTSTPEIGREVGEFWFGYLCDLGPDRARVVLRVDDPGDVATALGEARAIGGPRALTVWVDSRDRAARLDAALADVGARRGEATTHVTLVGPMTARHGPDDLVIAGVDESALERWATVKLQAFDNSEAAPAPDRLSRQVAIRRSEWAIAECRIGLVGGEDAAVLAYYRGRDQMVFNLATRVPFRHRGIAQAMLAQWVRAGRASGCRSMMINAAAGGPAERLHRRLGFVDEIYWYQAYDLNA